MKNKEGNGLIVWQRGRDNTVFKVDTKTGYLAIVDKYGDVKTYHRADQFLKDPEKYFLSNK